MKVKLLDIDLIRTFGGATVDMSDTQAIRYINNGKAKALTPSPRKRSLMDSKRLRKPKNNKMVWNPPEEKIHDSGNGSNEKSDDNPFPGPEDRLFSQI